MCRAFGNPERVKLVACLAHEATVETLLRKCSLSQSALSQHLAILRDARAVHTRREGKHIYYKAASPHVGRLARMVIELSNQKDNV